MHFSATTMKSTTKYSHLWLAAVFVAISGSSAAQQTISPLLDEAVEEEEITTLRRYSVELIVFENGTSVTTGNELFLPEELPEEPVPAELQDLPGRAEATDDDAGAEETAPVYSDATMNEYLEGVDRDTPLEELLGHDTVRLTILDPEQHTMTGIYQRLNRLDAYRPILHSGWTQVANDEALTPPIRLRTLGDVPLRFDGNLSLYLSRYLHLVVDLSLEEVRQRNDRSGDNVSTGRRDESWTGFGYDENFDKRYGPVIYRLQENRIVADGDLRYFDHPKFGVLARITRLEDIVVEPAGERPPEMPVDSGETAGAN